jgi:hypothetical protein
MRVATIFTGAAAAAAFGPAAAAAGGHAAGTGHQARTVDKAPAVPGIYGITNVVRPDTSERLSGSIRMTGFCSTTSHWVHLEAAANEVDYCWGYKGLWYWNPAFKIYAECGGNNYGWLYRLDGSVFSFHQGTTYRRWTNGINLSAIRISGWAGNDACPET